ncbi:UDP-glucose dehydrogenase family protein [Paenibacillus taihuensis]
MSGVKNMKITIIGTGYVGLVSGVCYAEIGNQVTCVDNDKKKISMLRDGEIPIYEPGLKELMDINMNVGRLHFTTELLEAVRTADLVIVAVGTPPLSTGEADLSFVESAVHQVALAMNGYLVIAIKSTVPVGTNVRVKQWIATKTKHPFDVVSIPEFMREGSAIFDTMHPDRIIIGADSKRASTLLFELHRPLSDQIMLTDIHSAEMIKYASNAFLATKISFINEIANICEKVGADVEEVALGMGLDRRIGSSFLKAGIGYGGSCFPKDTKALIQIAGNVEYDFKLLKSVVEVNQMQRWGIIEKLKQALGTLKGRKIAIWGLAFKPGTDDVREAPSLEIVAKLLELGAKIRLYDPVAMDNFLRYLGHPDIIGFEDALEAVTGCDAVCLLTEWEVICEINLKQVAEVMASPIIIDGRNVFDYESVKKAGIIYFPIGRSKPMDRIQST